MQHSRHVCMFESWQCFLKHTALDRSSESFPSGGFTSVIVFHDLCCSAFPAPHSRSPRLVSSETEQVEGRQAGVWRAAAQVAAALAPQGPLQVQGPRRGGLQAQEAAARAGGDGLGAQRPVRQPELAGVGRPGQPAAERRQPRGERWGVRAAGSERRPGSRWKRSGRPAPRGLSARSCHASHPLKSQHVIPRRDSGCSVELGPGGFRCALSLCESRCELVCRRSEIEFPLIRVVAGVPNVSWWC